MNNQSNQNPAGMAMQYASASSHEDISEGGGLQANQQPKPAAHTNMSKQLKQNLGMGEQIQPVGSHGQNSVSNGGGRAGSMKSNAQSSKNYNTGNATSGGGNASQTNAAFSNALQQQQQQMRNLMAGYNTNIKQGQKLKNAPGPIQYQSPQLTHGTKMQNSQAQSAQQLQPLGLVMHSGLNLKNPPGLPNMGNQFTGNGIGGMLGDVHHNSHQILPNNLSNNLNYINTNMMMPNTSTSKGFTAARGDQDLSQRSPNKRNNIASNMNLNQNKLNFQNQQKFLNQLSQMNQNTLNNLNQNNRNKNMIQNKNQFNIAQINTKTQNTKKLGAMPAVPTDNSQTRNQRVPQIKAAAVAAKSQSNKGQGKSRNVQLMQGIGTAENVTHGSNMIKGNKAAQGLLTGAHNQTQQQILDFQNKQLLNLNNSSLEGNIQSQTQVFLARSNSQTTAQNPNQLNFQGNRANQMNKKGQKNQKRQYDYDLSCYNDTDNAMMKMMSEPENSKKKASIKQKNNSESVPALSAHANDVQGHKAINNGSMSQATLQGEFEQIMGGMSDGNAGKGSRNKNNQLNQNSKTLYTNISLKELSQSPETRGQQTTSGISQNKAKSNKIMIAMGKNNKNQGSNRNQNAQYISNRRNLQNGSQERINMDQQQQQAMLGHVQQEQQRLVNNMQNNQQPSQSRNVNQNNNTYEIQNEQELQQYLNQINSSNTNQINQNNQQVQAIRQPQTESMGTNNAQNGASQNGGANGSILNIKTVQDINIYNNSFIVNTNGGQIPQNLQSQIQQSKQIQQSGHTTGQANSHNVSQFAQVSQNQQAQAQQDQSQAKKGGLKLRKDMRGIANGYGQSRSVSQGRNNVISQQSDNPSIHSNPALLQAQGRNNGSLTEHNSYGGANNKILNEQNQNRSTKAFEAYNNSGKINIQNNNRGGNIMNHVMNQQNLKNLQQNPNQKRIISNPAGKLFANVGANTGMIKNISGSIGNKQKIMQMQNQIGSQTGYYQNQNPKTLKQGINNILKGKISSSTSRLQSRTSSRMNQNPGTLEGADQQQINAMNHIKREPNSQQRQLNAHQINRIQINQGGTRNQYNMQKTGSHGLGQRATSHLENNRSNQNNQLQMMNIHDISAATDSRKISKTNNLSNLTGGDNMHSQSQVVIQQLNQSQKYSNNAHKQYQIQKTQIKNIYSHEVRKQSLQGIKNQSHLSGIMNINQQNKSNKFKNQLNQNSSENEGMTYISNAPFNGSGEAVGPMNYSVNVKQDQYFQNRGGIMNRVKTQDATSTSNIFKQETPVNLKQDHIINQIINQYQEKFENILEALYNVKKKIQDKCDTVLVESEMKTMTKSLDQFQGELKDLKVEIQQEKAQYSGDSQQSQQLFDQLLEQVIDSNQEATLIKALIQVDQGQNHESLAEFEKICGIQKLMHDFNGKKVDDADQANSLSSDMLLLMNFKGQNQKGAKGSNSHINYAGNANDQKLKVAMLMKSIVYKRIGDHDNALSAISSCINQFPSYKDAYLLRGQISLLLKKPQKAQQDFSKFIQLTQNDLAEMQKFQQSMQKGLQFDAPINQIRLQLCLGKECLGDAYKKLKKYKQASQSLQEAYSEMKNLQSSLVNLKTTQRNQIEYYLNKIKTKIAMSDYYQGKMESAIDMFQDLIVHYSRYDGESLKVQHKQIKCNYFKAKAILSLNEVKKPQQVNYQEALKYFSFCCKDEFDPELHELYNGNALFEIAKMFLKQKDIVNAQEFVQRATDNNYNSKRLSLYRDFIEGIVYLMKRKIKKGVQILTDLLEILLNGQREILRTDTSKKDLQNESNSKSKTDKLDRYNNNESNESRNFLDDQQQFMLETVNDKQSTINEKANQVASGKFTNDMYNYLIFYIYIYRSYGYVAIEKYEHALEDLSKAKKISPHSIDKATIYNKWLSRGILKMDTEEYLMASKYFGKASLRFPSNKDAFCLNAISIVRSYTYSMAGKYIDNQIKCDKVMQTKQFLDVAIQCCCKEQKQASLYFFRGLLNYQLHNFYDALCDFNVAIFEEEEATAQFHLARGRCYACLSILDEALKDLSIALELDENLLEAYIFRGKCAYLLGDNNLAFHDFQKLIISDQKNPIVHIYAGNLLMTTGAYKDAIKAFDNADTVQQTALASFQRIRCYCALSDLENAFEQMQLCMHLEPKEVLAQYDYKVLLPLISCVRAFDFSRDENGNKDVKGEQQQIEILRTCVTQITSIIKIYEKEEHLKVLKNDSPMTIQIIPNVNKIKIEKQYVSTNLISADEMDPKSVDLKPEERQSLAEVDRFGYYRENIFQLEEMYLYRSIFNTYLGKPEDALTDLNLSRKQHIQISQLAKKEQAQSTSNTNRGKKNPGLDTQNKEEMYGKFPASQLVSPMASVHSHMSQRTDLSDIGLCSLNVKEHSYNTLMILIQSMNWNDALKKANELLANVQANKELDQVKNLKQLYIVRALIYQELGNTEKYNQDLTVYMKHFQKINKNRENAVVIEPFDVKGRLCQYFEPVRMNFSKPKTKGGFNIWMRFSFSMPFVKPPNMIPNIDEETIQNEFNLKQIDAPMPESPWLRSCADQNFDPFMYLQEEEPSQKSGKEDDKSKKKKDGGSTLKLPLDSQNQQFLRKCYQVTKPILFNDDKLVEDIDDLSDMDKVSLISDVEVQSPAPRALETRSKSQDGSLLNLKGIEQINKDQSDAKKSRAIRVHNGLSMPVSKFLCPRSKSCSSCYKLPADPAILNISNQEQLITNLSLTEEQREQGRRQKIAQYFSNPEKYMDGFADDTVSDEEYASSSEAEDSTSKVESSDANGSTKKEGKGKKGMSSSRYTHSRFSSNVGALEADPDYQAMLVGMGDGLEKNQGHLDIGQQDINVDTNIGKKLSKNENNNKSRVQLLGEVKPSALKHKAIMIDQVDKEQLFNKRIGSIQQQSEVELAASPLILDNTPETKIKSKVKDIGFEEERDSMVMIASKNIDKATKKKNKKGGGIGLGCMNNLKKNKLAIAFNNLEMEQNTKSDDD